MFEDMMNLMRINREYLQAQTKLMGIRAEGKKDTVLPRLKKEELSTVEDEDETLKKLGGMFGALYECTILLRQRNRGIGIGRAKRKSLSLSKNRR